MKNALILCAGSARRFYTDGESRPKCLLQIKPEATILDGLIRPLLVRGYAVVLGTGCGHQLVAAHVQQHADYAAVRCVYNADYATTNSIVTLWKLRDFVGDNTLVVNGDSVIDEAAFDLFTEEATPQVLVKPFPVFDDDTYRVVFDEQGSVARMGKDISDEPAPGCQAFVGISRVGNSELFLREIENLLQGGTRDTWPTTAYRNSIGQVTVRAHSIGDIRYFDVDTPEEFEAARHSIAAVEQAVSSP